MEKRKAIHPQKPHDGKEVRLSRGALPCLMKGRYICSATVVISRPNVEVSEQHVRVDGLCL